MIEVTDEMLVEVNNFIDNVIGNNHGDPNSLIKSIIKMYEANKSKPEPVAWVDMSLYPPIRFKNDSIRAYFVELEGIGLYTSPQPQPRAPLSEEKCNELFQWYAMQSNLFPGSIKPIDMIRAVEKAHGIGV